MQPSLQARMITFFLKIFRVKNLLEKKEFKTNQGQKPLFVPKRIEKAYDVRKGKIGNHLYATFSTDNKITSKHVVFFHGGGYVVGASPGHWQLVEKIGNRTNSKITFINYPLAPMYNYKDTFSMVQSVYDVLLKKYPEDSFVFMGDSAGGGLALALWQKLVHEQYVRLPIQMVLLSPWLDLTMSNPNIKTLAKTDYLLSLDWLRRAAEAYAAGDDQTQYLLSPINGEFRTIPPTILFYGTDELFFADCTKLSSKLIDITDKVLFREYYKMQHDWALFPIPESKQLVNEVVEFIKS